MLGDNIRTLRKSKGFTQEMFRAESHCRVQKASWQVPHMERSRREQMKEQLFEGLAQICPKGMCFPVIDYVDLNDDAAVLFCFPRVFFYRPKILSF